MVRQITISVTVQVRLMVPSPTTLTLSVIFPRLSASMCALICSRHEPRPFVVVVCHHHFQFRFPALVFLKKTPKRF